MFDIRRLLQVNRTVLGVIIAIVFIGLVTLFSAANGSIHPWVIKQLFRFALDLFIFGIVVANDSRWWLQHAYSIYTMF